ncbi:Uncharacterised protein [Cedecea neteri]|nr:Uncharacterised protein [Cedecea neteri]
MVVANSMLKNDAGSRHRSLIFGMHLEKPLNDHLQQAAHAATLSNYGNGCVFFEMNGGIYNLDANKGFNYNNLINRTIYNISCLRDSRSSRGLDNKYSIGEGKMHMLITLHAKEFNTYLREDQETDEVTNTKFKIPRFTVAPQST